MTAMTRAEAIREIVGLDQGCHADRGHGPYSYEWVREILHAVGVTDAEIDTTLHDGEKEGVLADGTTYRAILTLEYVGRWYYWGFRDLYTHPDGRISWSSCSVGPLGETWEELGEDIARMRKAYARNEVLDLTVSPPQIRPIRPRASCEPAAGRCSPDERDLA